MHDTGCLGLVHWDNPEGWNGEGGGRGVQDGEHMYLVHTLGLTLNEMQRDGQNMLKAGLLVMALSLILLAGDLTLRRKSGEHLAGWEGVSGVSTSSLGSPGSY